jgi:hypothetical protein
VPTLAGLLAAWLLRASRTFPPLPMRFRLVRSRWTTGCCVDGSRPHWVSSGPGPGRLLPSLARVAEFELTDQDDPLTAVEAIIAIDPNATEAQALIRPLADLLRDSTSAFSRQQAAFRLMKLGPSAAAAVAMLSETLKSRNSDGREKAAIVLGRIGSAARAAVPDLVTLARDDPTPSVRNAAQKAVTTIDRSVRSEFTAEP